MALETMRYRVRVGADADFNVAKAIAAANTHIYVVSDRRRTLSTGDLSVQAKQALQSAGAQIDVDFQFDPDAA